MAEKVYPHIKLWRHSRFEWRYKIIDFKVHIFPEPREISIWDYPRGYHKVYGTLKYAKRTSRRKLKKYIKWSYGNKLKKEQEENAVTIY